MIFQNTALIYFAIGSSLGAVCAFAIFAHRFSAKQILAQHQIESLQAANSVLASDKTKLEQQAIVAANELQQIQQEHAALKAQLDAKVEHYADKIKLLQDAKENLSAAFKNMAQQILEEKTAKMDEKQQQQLHQLINPFKDQLGEFKRKVEDVYDKESKDRAALQQEIHHLKNLNKQIAEDAVNLTQALKGHNKIQGCWGEMILARLLEQSGLEPGREYETQVSMTTEAGKRLQPDVIIHLPEERDVIVDAKVSLLAYEQAINENNTDLIKSHVHSVKTHIKGLADKSYADLLDGRSLDFVLLFIPIEGAFALIMQQAPELFQYAFDRKVVITSPSTLMVTLKTINNIWRLEQGNRNAQEIAKQAGGLYDKFFRFVDELNKIGLQLDKAKQSYDTAFKRLVTGKASILARTEKLKGLGAATKTDLSKYLVTDDPIIIEQDTVNGETDGESSTI